jgi:hypothetical protein
LCAGTSQICNVMRSKRLKKLDVCFDTISGSQEEQIIVHSAFESSVSLESLSLVVGTVQLAVSVLTGLKDGATNGFCQLSELKLQCNEVETMHYWTALSDFTHATQHLDHLQIRRVGFGREHMEALLDCLAWPSSISKLSFENCWNCWIGFEGMQVFLNFMGTYPKGSPLFELSFESVYSSDDVWSGYELVAMLCGRHVGAERPRVAAIGSQILSLSLWSVAIGGDGFLKAVAANAHLLALKKLEIHSLEP